MITYIILLMTPYHIRIIPIPWANEGLEHVLVVAIVLDSVHHTVPVV